MTIILIIIFVEFGILFLFTKSKSILSSKDLFPNISDELLNKFNSYDTEIGWISKKKSIKKEVSKGNLVEYTYNQKGARSLGIQKDKIKPTISTYGDSYCMCREVNDSETWQAFLSNYSKENILNFGVGNYGLDQSILRLKREFKSNQTHTVIIGITPYTITRITSVWKHLSEFHNVLAVKPRYIVKKNKLLFIPNIKKNKKDIKQISKFKTHFTKYDEHYSYFLNNIYSFPLTISFLFNPTPVLKVIIRKITNILIKLKFNTAANFTSSLYFKDEIIRRKKLFKKHKDLLEKIILEFIDFSKENNFKPVLLILPSIEDSNYIKKTSNNYYSTYFNIPNKHIKYLDFSDEIIKEESIGDLFIDNIWGGHYNKNGNQKIAEFLKNRL